MYYNVINKEFWTTEKCSCFTARTLLRKPDFCLINIMEIQVRTSMVPSAFRNLHMTHMEEVSLHNCISEKTRITKVKHSGKYITEGMRSHGTGNLQTVS
jgi:hypothetical protein